jgi:hypothetical protein
MPRKITVTLPDGRKLEGAEVGVSESSEKWSEFKLDDGTTIRAKLVLISAGRVDGQWDTEGNPVYAIKSHQVITVAEAPEALRKKVQ